MFVVGAHFDTVGGSPGADDNASGVASLLEMARVLAGHSFESSVELVAFALEEIGLRGSRQFAEDAAAAERDVIGMISLEMIGYTGDVPGCQVASCTPRCVRSSGRSADAFLIVQPPSQTWRIFLRNYLCDAVAVDFAAGPIVAKTRAIPGWTNMRTHRVANLI